MTTASLPIQPGILAPVPRHARYLEFGIAPGAAPAAALRRCLPLIDGQGVVAGLGELPLASVGAALHGLRLFPRLAGPGVDIPSTPGALWCWVRGEDRGEILHRARALEAALAPALWLESVCDGFVHAGGRDLTGYEDGTENPKGRKAARVAGLVGRGRGLDGSSFVAVQRWAHDLSRFQAMTPRAQDNVIGRRRLDNEELDDAPASAHVKRTAQESFSPEAFVLRRSMPWAQGSGAGLMFVAFGASFDAFEAQLRRMAGLEDGIVDALFRFTRPVSGAYYWCPPLVRGRLDLSAIGL